MNIRGAAVLALAASPSLAAAFTATPPGTSSSGLGLGPVVGRRRQQRGGRLAVGPLSAQRGGVPVLEDWKILRNGAAYGTVSNHPSLPDGDVITTSPLADPKSSTDGTIVVTKSGSKYKLGSSKNGARAAAPAKAKAKVAAAAAKPAPAKRASLFRAAAAKVAPPKKAAPEAKPVAPAKKAAAPQKPAAAVAKKSTAAPAEVPSGPSLQERVRQAKIDYGLSGRTVGDGRYLLAGKPQRSTSGKSMIFSAYRGDAEGLPTGSMVTVKLSPNLEAMRRESKNYDRVTSGLFSGRFVKKIEFLENAGSEFSNQCALVLETGKKNLKSVLSSRMNRGLSGRAMRNASSSAAQCIQAMHTSGLVWTDLKAENFVVLPDTTDMAGMVGIDLESAIGHRGNPVDYSPEACPPEFADAFLKGNGQSFVLDYSYDVWSYGMLLYELNVGRGYFSKTGASQVTKILRSETFTPDLGGVSDAKLRDLIKQCLQVDPKKRPGFAQILLHPYFLSTGIGPFSF